MRARPHIGAHGGGLHGLPKTKGSAAAMTWVQLHACYVDCVYVCVHSCERVSVHIFAHASVRACLRARVCVLYCIPEHLALIVLDAVGSGKDLWVYCPLEHLFWSEGVSLSHFCFGGNKGCPPHVCIAR